MAATQGSSMLLSAATSSASGGGGAGGLSSPLPSPRAHTPSSSSHNNNNTNSSNSCMDAIDATSNPDASLLQQASPPPPQSKHSTSASPMPESKMPSPPSQRRSLLLDKSGDGNGAGNVSATLEENHQYCLRWNNYQSNLTAVFDHLLQTESFVDVTLSTDEGQSIKCHKVVLSACSSYFKSLLSDNPSQHPIIILRDIEWSELKFIVDYMYKGQISVSQEEMPSLLKAAEALKIRGLVEFQGITEMDEGNRANDLEVLTEELLKEERRRERKRRRRMSHGQQHLHQVNGGRGHHRGNSRNDKHLSSRTSGG